MFTYKNNMKRTALTTALGCALLAPSAQATNWLMLQGTEKPNQAPAAKLWGFAQVEYQSTDDTKLKAGPWAGQKAAFNQMAPQLDSASGFNIRRARVSIRGANFPLDSNINYFLMAELGNNGITTGGKASQGQLTDASVTFNHLPGARVRVGLFKTPGSEELLKAIPVFNYVNFTNGTNRLLLERFFDNSSGDLGRNASVGAGRDTGLQIFDAFRQGDWEHSYALMLGNGNGLALTDNDENKDLYLYLSTEKVFDNTSGPRRHGVKLYAWMQDGKRTINISGAATEKNRKRAGLGMTYFDGKYRMAAEYITADGMIYGGTSGAAVPGALSNNGTQTSSFSVQTDEKAYAYQLDFGYRIQPKIELNLRYDALDSGTEVDANYREFRTTTLGAQYFFNKKTSARLNYEIRSIDAPKLPSSSPVHDILKTIDNRVSAQVTMVF
ncbi:porin [Thiomicrorhabdus sp.]|uniref:porin n=1 Tax=Thiomicrorhabdus sp. TaxID=2039724 RepID=UPI0029C79593|nr:porin [Thiomicrorhabdus sp.]